MNSVLDDPAWNALNTGNKHLAYGSASVKYFDKDVSPFVGLKDNSMENFRELYDLLPHDGPVGFVSAHEFDIPHQWQVLNDIKCWQMIYNGLAKLPPTGPELVALTDAHIPQMLALTKLTNPGPFAQRTIDFGHYYGVLEDDKLVAMAGQRMHINKYVEISAVCTHPDHLGKGYAKQLLDFQINRMIAASGIPILHVRTDNHRAIEVYERAGFSKRCEMWFNIMKKV